MLTTEKDYVRLENRIQELSFLGIETSFLSEQEAFDTIIKNHLQ
jgi:tetraacyldisaccharide 4'-kinase